MPVDWILKIWSRSRSRRSEEKNREDDALIPCYAIVRKQVTDGAGSARLAGRREWKVLFHENAVQHNTAISSRGISGARIWDTRERAPTRGVLCKFRLNGLHTPTRHIRLPSSSCGAHRLISRSMRLYLPSYCPARAGEFNASSREISVSQREFRKVMGNMT